jgi:hypothetical protein
MHMQANNAGAGHWGLVRLALGVLQVCGAALSLALLVQTGITPLSLGAAVSTSLLTTISILLFGRRRPQRVSPKTSEGNHG